MGFLGIIQNDIKRVVAYSTLSQLGYMTVALGVSAYGGGVPPDDPRLLQGAAVPGAGSVIIGMHHDQDIRNMGGLRKYMPITWITSLLGSAGADRHAVLLGLLLQGQHHRGGARQQAAGAAGFAYFAVVAGVFVTAFYSFRMYFLVFHGKERFRHKPFPGEHDHHDDDTATAMPTRAARIALGGDGAAGAAGDSVGADRLPDIRRCCSATSSRTRSSSTPPASRHGGGGRAFPRRRWRMALHAFATLPFWLALAGVVVAYGSST
jgi:NADH-quinone oxidoreductase subunit L